MLVNNFKYSIPEMDRILDAAANRNIPLSNYHETLSEIKSEGRLNLIQIASMKTADDTSIQLIVSSYDIKRRGGAKIIPFPKPELLNTKDNVTAGEEI
jgi:hypothetical protein